MKVKVTVEIKGRSRTRVDELNFEANDKPEIKRDIIRLLVRRMAEDAANAWMGDHIK